MLGSEPLCDRPPQTSEISQGSAVVRFLMSEHGLVALRENSRVRIGTTCGVPGRDRDLAWLIELYAEVVAQGRGQIVFLVGDEGTGRTALLRGLTDELGSVKRRPVVLAGGFEDARYVAWNDDAPPARVVALLKRILSVGESAAALADGILPFAGLVGLMVSGSRAALQLAESLADQRGPPDLSVLMPSVLRRLCEDKGPVVCIVDDADQAPGGWWADLVLLFARRVARDLPLLLILAVDGPARLGAHEDDEPDTLFVARQLTTDGLASWHPLTPVTVDDLQRWTGPAMPDVLRRLLEVTGGRADWTAALWHDWQRRAAVEQSSTDGRWRFTVDRERAFDEVDDLLGERLKRLVGTNDLNALEQARKLLCCAALEGHRFTADAVALALRRDREVVIDELDETLALDEKRPDGLVNEDGSVTVSDETGQRSLWLYRFNAELDWLTLRHHGLTQNEQPDLSRRLAHAMRALYGGQAHRVAQTLARLYETAGQVEDARHFRRMGDIGVSREVILWRARKVLASPDPEDRSERRRASQILIAAAEELFHSGPLATGLHSVRQRTAFQSYDAIKRRRCI